MPKHQRPEVVALAILMVALIVALASVLRWRRPAEPVKVTTAPAATMISVHVVGEVLWPGLYVLKAGARVQDAIFAAHGPTLIADLKRVNLAAILRDGDRVVIPRISQPPYPYTEAQLLALSQKAGRPPPGASEAAPPAGKSSTLLRAPNASAGEAAAAVNVNTATAADLERLPGVGPVLARRIVEFREARGLFRRLEDLQDVEGIGPKLYRRLEPMLRLE
jgi:competence protein ComEA